MKTTAVFGGIILLNQMFMATPPDHGKCTNEIILKQIENGQTRAGWGERETAKDNDVALM